MSTDTTDVPGLPSDEDLTVTAEPSTAVPRQPPTGRPDILASSALTLLRTAEELRAAFPTSFAADLAADVTAAVVALAARAAGEQTRVSLLPKIREQVREDLEELLAKQVVPVLGTDAAVQLDRLEAALLALDERLQLPSALDAAVPLDITVLGELVEEAVESAVAHNVERSLGKVTAALGETREAVAALTITLAHTGTAPAPETPSVALTDLADLIVSGVEERLGKQISPLSEHMSAVSRAIVADNERRLQLQHNHIVNDVVEHVTARVGAPLADQIAMLEDAVRSHHKTSLELVMAVAANGVTQDEIAADVREADQVGSNAAALTTAAAALEDDAVERIAQCVVLALRSDASSPATLASHGNEPAALQESARAATHEQVEQLTALLTSAQVEMSELAASASHESRSQNAGLAAQLDDMRAEIAAQNASASSIMREGLAALAAASAVVARAIAELGTPGACLTPAEILEPLGAQLAAVEGQMKEHVNAAMVVLAETMLPRRS